MLKRIENLFRRGSYLNLQCDMCSSQLNWACDASGFFNRDETLLTFSNQDLDLNYTNLSEFIERSEAFPIAFPINSVRCQTLQKSVPEAVLLRNINSSYPILHEYILQLFTDFILHKRKFGSGIEREFYKNMTLIEFVNRLLQKRAVMFMNPSDDYVLLNGVRGRGKWETIGKDLEKGALTLEKCLSYDEIKLAAFLSVSSYSYFINNGNRHNKGIPVKDRTNLEEEGVIIGLIGARLEKPNVMEYEEIIISQEQNIEANGYGTVFAPTIASLFSGFYGKPSWTYMSFINSGEAQNSAQYMKGFGNDYFDNITYSKRIIISIDTLLFEANHRAQEKGTFAYVYIVGIGLGVWQYSTHQKKIFLDTSANRIELLGKHLQNISDVTFAYFSDSTSAGNYNSGAKIPIKGHPNGGIRIIISERQPHEVLVGEDKGKLLVVSYAWDGNALPGNEFWIGMLAASGDPAAASSSQIAELHNPHINRNVSAGNLRIATKDGVCSFKEYLERNKK